MGGHFIIGEIIQIAKKSVFHLSGIRCQQQDEEFTLLQQNVTVFLYRRHSVLGTKDCRARHFNLCLYGVCSYTCEGDTLTYENTKLLANTTKQTPACDKRDWFTLNSKHGV